MYSRFAVHLVWTTRDRLSLIDRERAAFLWDNLPIVGRQERALVVEVGIVSTHVHLLLCLHPMTLIPRMLQRMKGGTATLMNRQIQSPLGVLHWAKGYSLTSVCPRHLDAIAAYVRHQDIRHPNETIPGWINKPVASATSAEPRL
jgi:REP element-mobilizing transposase RayT